MSDIINIENYKIGTNQSVFVIAEVGVNHNGDLELAKKLIKEASRCGANCVKFQTFKAEKLVVNDAPKAEYQLKTTSKDESQLEMLQKLEMDTDKYYEIIRDTTLTSIDIYFVKKLSSKILCEMIIFLNYI